MNDLTYATTLFSTFVALVVGVALEVTDHRPATAAPAARAPRTSTATPVLSTSACAGATVAQARAAPS